MTKKEILDMMGIDPNDEQAIAQFYEDNPTPDAFMMKYGGMVEQYGSGGYTVRRSNDRKGKTHVVIGPGGKKKYFGDPKLGERGKSKYGKEAFYKRHAKNLKNNPYFRAYARATWEDGGMINSYADGGQLPVDLLEARMKASGASQAEIDSYKAQHYANGGLVDVYNMMGMPMETGYYADGGKIPAGVLRSRLEAHMSPEEAQDYLDSYKKGGWIQKATASIKRRGTEGVCTGSKFGGPGCPPGSKRYNLAKTFRKMAKARKKEEGGYVDMYEDGGIPETTQGELERGEVLNVYRNGGWETSAKYDSQAMSRHNADGTPKPEQVVTLPVGGSITPRYARKWDDIAKQSGDTLLQEAWHGKVLKDGGRIPGIIEWKKMRKEAKENEAAVTAYNKFTKKYGGAIQRMYANGGMVPMYRPGGKTQSTISAPPAVANILRNVAPNPYLGRLLQGNAAPAPAPARPAPAQTARPATRTTPSFPYNSNVTMSPGLAASIANSTGSSNFYLTGPNYRPDPGTTGSRSVQDIIRGVQPSPFFQQVTRGIQPSPTFQNIVNGRPVSYRPATPATPSTATNVGRFQPSRPGYVTPGSRTGTRPAPASSAAARRPAAPVRNTEPMTMMQPLGLPTNVTLSPNTAYNDFDLGNVSEAQRMYEAAVAGPMMDVPAINQYSTPADATTPGATSRELTGDELWGTDDANPGSSWMQRKLGQPNSSERMNNFLQAAQFIPGLYNLGRGIFEKAWEPGSYETPADLRARLFTGEAGQRQMERAYAGTKYAARNIGGSNALAALTANAGNYYGAIGKYYEDLENRNRIAQAETDRLNKSIQQSNMQMRMQRDYLAQQAKERKAEMIGKTLEDMGTSAGQLWQNRQMMDALRMAYPQNQAGTYSTLNFGTPATADAATTYPQTSGMFDYSRPTFRQYQSWKNR
jgi:hypothetical protein